MSNFEERFPDLYLSTESESRERAAILPTEGSEDATAVLGIVSLPENESSDADVEEYLPEQQTEWVITVSPALDTTLNAQEVAKLFGKEWRERYGGLTIFGKSAETGLWTFLISADGPTGVTALKFAWPYYATWAESPDVTPSKMYSARIQAVQNAISTLSPNCQFEVTVIPEDAEERSRFLSTIEDRFGADVTLCVQAPAGKTFDGREIWDVMLCLGLQWGDMDCFHWRNESGVGDDFFFSVWTTTPPGYFLPEDVASNNVHVTDLVFSYSLPRCAAPGQVFDSMYAATQYVQKRLGGTVTDGAGNRIFNAELHKAEIEERTRELNELGFKPGSEAALSFF
ncbi:MAG: cell division protein ZipA C-terminal FtsZ-binding domain-containing protein [Planctomycetaceae bacterium]